MQASHARHMAIQPLKLLILLRAGSPLSLDRATTHEPDTARRFARLRPSPSPLAAKLRPHLALVWRLSYIVAPQWPLCTWEESIEAILMDAPSPSTCTATAELTLMSTRVHMPHLLEDSYLCVHARMRLNMEMEKEKDMHGRDHGCTPCRCTCMHVHTRVSARMHTCDHWGERRCCDSPRAAPGPAPQARPPRRRRASRCVRTPDTAEAAAAAAVCQGASADRNRPERAEASHASHQPIRAPSAQQCQVGRWVTASNKPQASDGACRQQLAWSSYMLPARSRRAERRAKGATR